MPGLVSVIIPTYNRADLLKDAMDSVYLQTYRPIELIVVDDGSTDHTQIVVIKWKDKCIGDELFKLRYIRQENSGAQVARNFGSIESRGEFIQHLDSDDLLLKEKLQRQVEVLHKSGKDFVYSQTAHFARSGSVECKIRKPSRSLLKKGYITSHLWSNNSLLFRRYVCVRVGPWDEELKGCQEYEYAARIKTAGFCPDSVNEVHAYDCVDTIPSISRSNSLQYAQAIEMAACKILRLLETSGLDSSIERNHVAWNLVANALRFARCNALEDARRCLHQATIVSMGLYKFPIYLLRYITILLPPLTVLEFARFTIKLFWCLKGVR